MALSSKAGTADVGVLGALALSSHFPQLLVILLLGHGRPKRQVLNHMRPSHLTES